jgi:hypothetical protein
MCSPVRCDKCGKATWAGCGQHIEEALSSFSEDQRCKCDNDLSGWVPKN